MKNVFGPALIDVSAPDGWTVKTIVQDGRDITDRQVELHNGEQLANLRVVLTNQVTSVAGQITNERGAAVPDGTVIVFADRPDKWFEGSRFVRAERPDQNGRYQIKGLPPGDYLAVALDYIEEGAWNDPEYLAPLRQRAQKITLNAGRPRRSR